MDNLFDVLVYLDENLVRNLSSLVLTGYIETTTLTQSFDRTLSAGIRDGDKNENFNQGIYTKTEREGYKDKNSQQSNNALINYHVDRDFDAKQCVKEERQIKTTYTTFVLNGNLINHLNKNNQLHHKDETDIEKNNVYTGDLIEIEGTITNECILTYIDTLTNLLNIFGCEYLNSLLQKKETKINFSMFLKMLTYLQEILKCNNTLDLIMKTGNGTVILTVNKDNFMNGQCNIFDKINCHCKVVGKVIKTCSVESDTISLLRKTGQEKFYENFFKKCEPLLECLTRNDIVIPQCPKLRLEQCAIQIMPLNIYM
ncbi:DUF6414 family protein [Clostridium saccharobutylicum]|uniref:Uncharacterized protein n=1 Tax=Clostridium saccharobutylicum TaxID=169679 RepID=A0A1S8MT44_CLOSA|nr:hypothetical protein [Clostridium saccharobutylicum]OOM07359.1 hypothetical protein CLOSAC_38880 [Clostridium saccharobutylicum]